ncbi:MAG: hypothetical protein AAGI71_13755 [Bacteroidota bacterium]
MELPLHHRDALTNAQASVWDALFFVRRHTQSQQPVILVDGYRAHQDSALQQALTEGTAWLRRAVVAGLSVEQLLDGTRETALRVIEPDTLHVLLLQHGMPTQSRLRILDEVHRSRGPCTIPVVWLWKQDRRLDHLGLYAMNYAC